MRTMALALFNLFLLIMFEQVTMLIISNFSDRHSTPNTAIDDVDGDVFSTFDLSPWSTATASSTCGENGPETFCYLTDSGLHQGHHCEECDAKNVTASHPVRNILDGTKTWWKSANAEQEVTIDIDLGREFYVSYVAITMGPSPKPANWILEKSVDFGATYRQWQFFSENSADCNRIFGVTANLSPRMPDQVLCDSDTFKMLKNEEVFVMLIKGRPGDSNFTANTKLQEWSKATNVRLRFLRLQTLLGEKIHNDLSMRRRHFYSIRSVVVGGHCFCHGHEETCIFDQLLKEIRCVCTGNTCGPSCSECCPAFHQTPWMEAEDCQACNCFGHADWCVYNETVAKLRWSMDSTGNFVGGGVCLECRHHTEGINCERCQQGFYRVPGRTVDDIQSCQACKCNSVGSVEDDVCHPIGGQCRCLDFVTGRRCNQCLENYWDFPNCKPCNCSHHGSIGPTCNSKTGQCHCLGFVSGMMCDTCLHRATRIMTANGCLICDACGVAHFNDLMITSSHSKSVSHWTGVIKHDLASNSNLVQRRLDSLLWRLVVARNLTSRMPIADLMASHVAGVLSYLKLTLAGLSSGWNEVELNWMVTRSKAASLKSMEIVADVTRLNSSMNRALSRLNNNSMMFRSVADARCVSETECWTYASEAVGEMTTKFADNVSAVKVRSYIELDEAEQLRSFVRRFFWTWRRVRVAVSKLRNHTDYASTKSNLTSIINSRHSPFLKSLQFEVKKLQRSVKQLPILNGLPLTTLSKDVEDSFGSLDDFASRLGEANYTILEGWSSASLKSLDGVQKRHILPYVDVLTREEVEISTLLYPLREESQVRYRLSDNLTTIARLINEVRESLDILIPLRNISDYEGISITSGSGYPNADHDDDERLEFGNTEIEYQEDDGNGSPDLDEVKERRQTGLDLTRLNLYLSDRVEAVSKKLSRYQKDVNDVEMTLRRTADALKVLEVYKPPPINIMADVFKAIKMDYISHTLQQAISELSSVRSSYGELEAATNENQMKFSETQRTVLNVTAAVDRVQRLSMSSIKSWERIGGAFKAKIANLRNLINKWHKAASRYQMAVSLAGRHLKLPVEDQMFDNSVVTRIEMAFRSTLPNSFLMLIGSERTQTCRILAYLNKSILTVSLRLGDETVDVEHPLFVGLNTWYHFTVHWILDRINLTLKEVKTKNSTALSVGTVLPAGRSSTRRHFEPATVFLGRPPRDVESSIAANLSDFHGCVDSLKVNGRLIGLISPEVTPCLSPPIAPMDVLDVLSFDGHDALCVAVRLNSTMIIEFQLRTMQRNSVVIFTKFYSKGWLAVVIKNGELVVELANDEEKLGRSWKPKQLTISSGLRCNDGHPHLVELTVVGNSLHLIVDKLYRNSQIVLQFGTLIVTEVYLGGLPNDESVSSLCYATNFHGCLMGFKLANSKPVATSALSCASVTCPEFTGFDCLCSFEQPIRLKKLDFVVGNLAVAFALRSKMTPFNRTVLSYSTSPYSGFDLVVGNGSKAELMSATVWFWSRDGKRRVGGVWRPLIYATWHSITMNTNETSSVVTVDGNVYEAPAHGLVQRRLYASQHRLFLGPGHFTPGDHAVKKQPLCYKDLIINEGPVDLSLHLDVSSSAVTCPVTL